MWSDWSGKRWNFFFGSESAIIRFDMSEFMERHTVAKLIGATSDYIHYIEGGQLTEAVNVLLQQHKVQLHQFKLLISSR